MTQPNPALRDWPEDFSHENGNYNCICGICNQQFVGHKRRVCCKVCSEIPPAALQRETGEGAFNEDGCPVCCRCGQSVKLREHSEHDGFCDSCAHSELSQLRAANGEMEAERLKRSKSIETTAWLITARLFQEDLGRTPPVTINGEVPRAVQIVKDCLAEFKSEREDENGIHPEYHRGRSHEAMETADELASLTQQLADAKGRLEEAEKNAARYQWIRSEGLQHIKWEGLTTDTCDVGLDYAIDARLAQPNP